MLDFTCSILTTLINLKSLKSRFLFGAFFFSIISLNKNENLLDRYVLWSQKVYFQNLGIFLWSHAGSSVLATCNKMSALAFNRIFSPLVLPCRNNLWQRSNSAESPKDFTYKAREHQLKEVFAGTEHDQQRCRISPIALHPEPVPVSRSTSLTTLTMAWFFFYGKQPLHALFRFLVFYSSYFSSW
jgi:hypothetical protein